MLIAKLRGTLVVLLLLAADALSLESPDIRGSLGIESRGFFDDPLLPEQASSLVFSLSFRPEFYWDWAEGRQSLVVTPFLRLDQQDSDRSHGDLREFYWQLVAQDWELSLGLKQFFWGVTESRHSVDIINQSDWLENIDGEQKLGQPVIQLSWIAAAGILDAFVLPGFRERDFVTGPGRLRLSVPVEDSNPLWQSSLEEHHVDFALRWSQTVADLDFALSAFRGTNREARLVPEVRDTGIVLRPAYDQISQLALESLWIAGGWIWKLESLARYANHDWMTAVTAGFEYTFANIRESGLDLGLITEYLHEDRNEAVFGRAFFNRHLFTGARLAFNDVQSTDILAGAIASLEHGSVFYSVEGSRRLGDRVKASLEARFFYGVEPEEAFYGIRKDSNLRLGLDWYF